MLVKKEDIKSFIPQGPPFVMIDELLYSDETITRARLLVTPENIFVEDGKFKEPGLIENIAQTAAIRAGYHSYKEDKRAPIGYIGAVKNLQIISLPKVGDQLVTEITIQNKIFNATLITGKIMCNEKIITQCEMKIFVSDMR